MNSSSRRSALPVNGRRDRAVRPRSASWSARRPALLAAAALAGAGCGPLLATATPPTVAPPVAPAVWTVVAQDASPAPASPLLTYQRLRCRQAATGREATVHRVSFEASRVRFRVLDQGNDGSGQARVDLATALARAGCVAGVNGGYFHPDFTPLGLVVADGRPVHPAERASLLSGFFVAGGRRAALLRREEYRPPSQPAADQQALQAGPFLVDRGRAVAGLEATRAARRTVVLTDGQNRWAFVSLSALTLAEAASLLAQPGLWRDLPVRRALNLDGGSSTALWFQAVPQPFSLPELGSVRTFLAVAPP